MTKGRVFRLACCLLMYSCASRAQSSGTASIRVAGIVFADGGTPRLQDVLVRLCDSFGRTLMETSTSASGQFQFNGLQAGGYLLQFEVPGFQKAETKLTLTFSSEPALSIYLKPLSHNSTPQDYRISARELALPETAMNLYREGKKKLYTGNDPQGALADFQKVLAQAPAFYEARYYAGMAHLALNHASDAEKEFRGCIDDSHNQYGKANIALGTLLVDRGEIDSGEQQIRHGLDLNPSAWLGHYQLGRLEAVRGHLDIAELHAEQALQLSPATAIVYQLLANIHVRQKNYEAALNDIDAYVKLDPDSPAGLRAREIRAQLEKQVQQSVTR